MDPRNLVVKFLFSFFFINFFFDFSLFVKCIYLFFFFSAQMPCNQCGKIILVSRMKYHLKIHSGHKPYLCELCGRAFVFRKSLNTHIRYNHLGQERPKHFMCSTCGHTCTSRNHLEKHERIHTDERVKTIFSLTFCCRKINSIF
jgi:KRAB domain-containing zinc finger protein